MKKILLLVGLLAAFTLAQTNAITYKVSTNNPVYEESGNAVFECTFTLDSLAGVASKVFTLPNTGTYNFASQNAYFVKKAVSTYGTPKLDIYVQRVANDTASVDSVCHQSTGETDTTGVLTFNAKVPTKFKVFIRCLNADINSGYLKITFPKVTAYKP